MPVKGDVAVSPDWELVASSGADFVVARETDLQKGALKSVINNVRSDDLYKLSNGVVIVPLRDVSDKTSLSSKSIFDNGYFKIIPVDNKSKLENIALGKVARQSSFGGGEARLSVDGNTDGNFVNGSVTHSGKDVNAWLEIDLGKTEKIDKVKIWNRTDCCGERLQDYWIFISETPFKSDDTATELKGRPGIWGKINLTPNPKSTIQTADVSGRYVRVQLSGTQPISESFLSLAEVEILQLTKQSTKSSTQEEGGDTNVQVKEFTTDYASYLRLDLENSQPVTIQYLFWDNPRLSYFLNGKLVKLTEKDGLKGIDVASGKNTLEIKYRHWPLTIFWLFYSMYALLLVWFLITSRSYAMMFIKVGFQWLRDYSKSKW